MEKNEKSIKLEKDNQRNNLKIETYQTTTTSNFRKTNLLDKNKILDPSTTLPVFTMFKGFYNKQFNLTNYKNDRENSRSRSRSPERRYEPHKLRGNGIPEDALERIRFLGTIFKEESFQKYYANRPQKRYSKFEEIVDYIINYRKNHSELESVMMAFYFVCHEIKYDCSYLKKNNNFENENNNKKNKKKFNIKNFQKPEIIYQKGKALSLGFTNLFEYILKRMEIKFKHLEGYCKLIPKDLKLNPYLGIDLLKTKNIPNLKIKITNIEDNKKNNNYLSPNKNKSNYNNTYYNFGSSRENLSELIKSIKSSSNIFSERKKENEMPINHCWNAIYIKGEWYFVDTLFGSGGILDEKLDLLKNPNDKRFCADIDLFFNPFYFMPLPKYLIMTHRPKEDNWQFVDKICTYNQFISKNYPDISQFYRGAYQYNVELLTHEYPIIEINSKQNLIIKLRLKKAVLQSDLYDVSGKNKIGDVKYTFAEKKNIFIFEPSFPSNGDYILRVNCRSLASTDLVYWPLVDYIVKVHDNNSFSHFDKYKKKILNLDKNIIEKKDILTLPKLSKFNSQVYYQPKIINDYNNFFPSKINKKICYDNDGFFLIEPRTTYLKKGNAIKFKVRIKGASVVSVLDGNHWLHLKKTEKDTYEGEKNIKTDNVSICCIRGKNIFTEVFRFKAVKEKSVDSKLFMIKLKNKSKVKK